MLPIRGSRWRRWPRPPSESGSARWSPHWHGVGPSRSPGKRRRSTGSAAADSRSASASEATSSRASTRLRARNSTTADVQACSTSRSRSWRPPGRANRCTTAARTTRSTACVSCLGRSSGQAYRCGSRATTASRGHCVGRRGTRVSSPSSWNAGTARRGRRRPRGAAQGRRQGPDRALRRRGRPPARQRSGALRRRRRSWWLIEFPWDAVSVDQVRAVIRDGPAPPA